ncbi:hypothetical protein BH10ACI4_BH10ACI4_28950 [soil metagenome]
MASIFKSTTLALALLITPALSVCGSYAFAQDAVSKVAPAKVTAVAPDAPPSATGVGEVSRLAETLQRATEEVRRLQQRLPDWAAVTWYAEENEKLGMPRPGERRVVFLGDSITHNWGNPKYTDYFQRPHKGFVPINRGIGGQNVAQMLLRLRPDVIDLQPKALVIFAGTNDLPTFKVPNVMKFIEDNFSSIFDLAEAHSIPVIICSVLPVNDAFTVRTATRPPSQILELNQWLQQTAQRRGMLYVNFYSPLSDGKDRLRKELTLDGLHPTSAGYSLMEPLIESAVLKVISK